jgi:beta-N-acetylhexosaminidase
MKKWFVLCCMFGSTVVYGQEFLQKTTAAQHWADSVKKKLSKKEKIAQLMVIRVSERQGGKDVFFEDEVSTYIKKYNIGAVCLFQGDALKQAEVLNRLQAQAKTPLMVTVDGETGLGMRFSDVSPFPNQLTIGAVADEKIAYKVGKAIADQCIRAGIQVNYAPVVDINNNPANPVINVRSFGENKEKVARFGVQIMKGMQDAGVMACAKHFPGHGDVSVDSHYDLPVILKSKEELDALELYPFKVLSKEGVGSMMMAHLYIPAIDTTKNKATSVSKNNVTDLLRNEIGYQGLTFTDALEMKGVAKFYPQGEAATISLIAGNDMLCLPGDIKGSIKSIRKAIRKKELSWKEVNEKLDRVLISKYHLGLNSLKLIDTTNIVSDLNADLRPIKEEVYAEAITLLKQADTSVFPLAAGKKVAYVGVGISSDNLISSQLKNKYGADLFFFDNKADEEKSVDLLEKLKLDYDAIIVGVHAFSKNPANDFGISKNSLFLLNQLQQKDNAVHIVFGNPYMIKNIAAAQHLIAAYEDDAIMQEVAFKLLEGGIKAKGTLPVTINNEFKYGAGIK